MALLLAAPAWLRHVPPRPAPVQPRHYMLRQIRLSVARVLRQVAANRSSASGLIFGGFRAVFHVHSACSVPAGDSARRADGAGGARRRATRPDGGYRGRRDNRYRPGPARIGDRQYRTGTDPIGCRCPRAGRYVHFRHDQRIVAADQWFAGDSAQWQADIELFRNSGHSLRSGGAGRNPARTGRALLWLCADAEGRQCRAARAIPRRNRRSARGRDDAGRAGEWPGRSRDAAHSGRQSLHPEPQI